ncbi:hypothetical protein J6590_095514 [Homalodisca vitripennis]|nr:hypothetical protein J6590_095514 [Homalodisca vitripennis]
MVKSSKVSRKEWEKSQSVVRQLATSRGRNSLLSALTNSSQPSLFNPTRRTQMFPDSLSTQHVSKLPVDFKSQLHCTPRCQGEEFLGQS